MPAMASKADSAIEEKIREAKLKHLSAGGSRHSFDFDSGSQRMCLKGTLFT